MPFPSPYFLNLSGFIVRYRQKIVRLPANAFFVITKATDPLRPCLGSVKILPSIGVSIFDIFKNVL